MLTCIHIWYISCMGSIKQIQASKRRWADLTLDERKERMKPLIEARWKGVSKKAKKAHAVKMALARWAVKK
jgi:hypothetical protein